MITANFIEIYLIYLYYFNITTLGEPSIKGLSKEIIVRFSHIENNARVINIVSFVNDDKLYFEAEKNLNLAILELLEKEGIDFLYVELETSPEKHKLSQAGLNN